MRRGRNKDGRVRDGLLRSAVYDLTFDDASGHRVTGHSVYTHNVPAFLTRAEQIQIEISARCIASAEQRHADPPFLHDPVSTGEFTEFHFATRADHGEVLREVSV